MLKDKRAQDHHASAQFVCPPIGIEITHSRHLLITLAVDAEYLGFGSEVEIVGFQRHWDRRVERCGLGVHMAAVKIAVSAVNAGRSLGDARIERLGWTIRLGKNSRRGVVRMVTEFFAGFGEQLHARYGATAAVGSRGCAARRKD